MAANVGSLDGITIPTQSAPIQKKNIRRQPNDANAFRMTLRGRSDSPAAMDINSGPTILPARITISTPIVILWIFLKKDTFMN